MADPKLTDYIEDARKKGYSDVHIADRLRKAGYTEAHIENTLRKEQSAAPVTEKPAKNKVWDNATTFSIKNKPKPNTTIWIALVIVAVVIIGALIFGQSIKLKQVTETPFEGETETPNNGGETAASWQYPEEYSMIEYNSFEVVDTSLCNGIESSEEFDSCFANLPKMGIKTIDDCETISNNEIKLLCIAIINGNKESCDATQYTEFCYSLQVRNRRDISGCSLIENEITRNNCIANFNQEEAIAQFNYFLFIFRD